MTGFGRLKPGLRREVLQRSNYRETATNYGDKSFATTTLGLKMHGSGVNGDLYGPSDPTQYGRDWRATGNPGQRNMPIIAFYILNGRSSVIQPILPNDTGGEGRRRCWTNITAVHGKSSEFYKWTTPFAQRREGSWWPCQSGRQCLIENKPSDPRVPSPTGRKGDCMERKIEKEGSSLQPLGQAWWHSLTLPQSYQTDGGGRWNSSITPSVLPARHNYSFSASQKIYTAGAGDFGFHIGILVKLLVRKWL